MDLASSVRAPHSFLVAKSMVLSWEYVPGFTHDHFLCPFPQRQLGPAATVLAWCAASLLSPLCLLPWWQRLVGVGNAAWSSALRAPSQLGNDLATPNYWMYSLGAKKVMMLSDPKHRIISCPSCSLGPHTIALTGADISAMRAADGRVDGDVPRAR